jgi:hypothetical protein
MRFFGSKITRHRTLPFAGGLDADAVAYLTAAGITDATQITAVNNIFKDFKGQGPNNSTYDFYTRLTAFWLFVGGTAAAHKFNAKDPRDVDAAYRLVFSGGWTHSANGSKGNGTNTSANTFIAQNLISNSANGLSVYFRENVANNEIQIGYLDTSTYKATEIGMGYTSGANTKFFGGNKYDENFGATNYQSVGINGLIRLNRTTSNNYKVYRNGSQTESFNYLSYNNTDTSTLVIGGVKKSSGGVQAYSNKTFCFADIMLANTLSAAEEAAYYTCIQAFQTALSRQV